MEKMKEGWYEAQPDEAKAHFDAHPDALILDVREPDEFASGHIANAKNVPLQTVLAQQESLGGLPKDQEIWVYCRSGRRSQFAAHHLASLGYTRAINFQGVLQWPYGLVK